MEFDIIVHTQQFSAAGTQRLFNVKLSDLLLAYNVFFISFIKLQKW